MIVEYFRYTIADEKAQAFETAYAHARESLDASPHCLGYELSRGVEDRSSYTLRIEWDSLEGHERGFRGGDEFRQFLPHIRPFIGDIQEMRHYEVVFARDRRRSLMSEVTVFEAAGGADVFLRLTRRFYAQVADDPILAPVFAEMTEDHVEGVALWLGEVFGGPRAYTEQRGGYPHMVSRHVNRALTEVQRARWAELMISTARDVLPASEKVQARFRSYIVWGSKIALQNSQPGYEPPAESDIPDWGWGKNGPPAD